MDGRLALWGLLICLVIVTHTAITFGRTAHGTTRFPAPIR
jgi:hypothetical protein